MDLSRLLFNTLYYAFGALAFQLVFDVAAAYSLSKLRPVFGKVILGMMLATLMIPATVLVVPQYLTVLDVPIVQRNLLNSPWAIWLPSVTNAFNIFLLKRFFDSIPRELLDAAAIDGASPLRTLRSVVLPISRPILGVVSIFAVVGVWKDFLWPMLTLPDPSKQTLNVGIYSLSQRRPGERPHRGAHHRVHPDAADLPALPAQHHERSHRGRPQGLEATHRSSLLLPSTPPPALPSSAPLSGAGGGVPPARKERHVAANRPSEATVNWWRDAAIYQIYVRSFADGDGDGTGDLAGVRAKLPYLVELGVDALWFTPWYLSPLADGGYDVADYRTIDPAFGTLAEAEKLIAEARELGIRTIIDIVPNHVSDQHVWFRAALAAGPGSPERELFHFRPGRGADGEIPPNDWVSEFGGTPWTRLDDGEWYLHLFATQQPDLNWAHPAVRQEHEDVLRFWFERGVEGVRIDSAALPAKDPALPDFVEGRDPHPYIDRDELHDIYRSWRAIADEYGAIFVGEVWLPDAERFARYLRPDELHTAFNFNFLACPWDAGRLRSAIDDTLAEHAAVGAPATWVLCNHDVTRTVTRYGREDTGFDFAAKTFGTPTDLALGTRRARAAALLSLALPGAVYLYQGEELGLPEADIPPRPDPGPDALPLRRDRPGTRRLPGAAALVGAGAVRRFRIHRRALAAAARGLGDVRRRSAARRSGLDAQPVPRGAPAAPHRARLRQLGDTGGAAGVVADRARGAGLHPRRAA